MFRKRAKFDKQGHTLLSIGTYFHADLYQAYRTLAFFRGENVYDLINEAMAAYLPELQRSKRQRLKEAGQKELGL